MYNTGNYEEEEEEGHTLDCQLYLAVTFGKQKLFRNAMRCVTWKYDIGKQAFVVQENMYDIGKQKNKFQGKSAFLSSSNISDQLFVR